MPQPEGPLGVTATGWGWRHAGRRAFAVRGLDLLVEPGERVLLLGASGAGKSTVLLGLAGLLGGEHEGEAEGSLLVGGVPAREARRRAGLVMQDPESQVVLARCGDDVAFGLENTGVPTSEIWPRVGRALADVGFPYAPGHATAALSGGEKQRLVLAGVLAMRPGLLLLDEPTANLDEDGAALVRDAVARITAQRRTTVVLVEHRVAGWLPLVDRVVVLSPGGGVALSGAPREVLSRHIEALTAAGVWVPDAVLPGTAVSHGGPVAGGIAGAGDARAALLRAERLAVARPGAPVAATGVELTVTAGGCIAVTGPNGAGKSTLALTLAGLITPAAGLLAASPALSRGLRPEPSRWRSRELVSRIGTVFQEPEHQFLAGTVEAELRLAVAALPAAERDARLQELLERLHLERLARANPFTLSGGEKRRLSVGTALGAAPSVLVLDEPTFGQDPRTWSELVALLTELMGQGTGVVAATHDERLVDRLATAVVTLPAGAPAPAGPARLAATGAAP